MQDQFVSVDGIYIRYRDTSGSGPCVLLTHGIAGSLEMWHKQLDAADGSLRLIAWDLPGHGLSALGTQPYDPDSFSRFAWRFVDVLGVDQLFLAGNSLGGAISLRMADAAADRVLGLLLANAATLDRGVTMPFRLMTLPLLGELMNKPGPMAVEQQLKAIFHDPAVVTDEIRAFVTRNVNKEGGGAAFLATLRRMTGLGGQNAQVVARTRQIISGLQAPAIFVHGRQDAVVPVVQSVAAATLYSRAELVVLDPCGHTPQIEQPERFNQILTDLVKRAASREGGSP
jgi:pimeloyl-ACP methyl ester carboxylesterase